MSSVKLYSARFKNLKSLNKNFVHLTSQVEDCGHLHFYPLLNGDQWISSNNATLDGKPLNHLHTLADLRLFNEHWEEFLDVKEY